MLKKLFGSISRKNIKDESQKKDLIDFNQNRYKIFNQVGVSGTIESFWENKYHIVYNSGYYEIDKSWVNGEVALIKNNVLLYKSVFIRPWYPKISQNGTMVLVDWLAPKSKEEHSKTSVLYIISENGEYAIAETTEEKGRDSNKLFLININDTSQNIEIDKPNILIEKIKIDVKSKIIKLLNDKNVSLNLTFDGLIKNKLEYKERTLELSSISEKYNFYSRIPKSENYQDECYLKFLLKLVDDEEYSERFNKAKLYRKIGEFYFANEGIEETLFYWNKALKINPKVGIKTKYNALVAKNDKEEND